MSARPGCNLRREDTLCTASRQGRFRHLRAAAPEPLDSGSRARGLGQCAASTTRRKRHAQHGHTPPTPLPLGQSNKPRLNALEKEDYFHHFLEDQPVGKIDLRSVEIGCNWVVDAGLYTFSFAKTGAVVSGRYSFTYRWTGADWLITNHHSSAMPEKR